MNADEKCWMQGRRAGVLLHPTSLPHPAGQGDLGPEAFRFVDWLAAAGFSVWQMLPVGPVHHDRSPYLPRSCFAGHTGLISADILREEGLLDAIEAQVPNDDLPDRRRLLQRAWTAFQRDADGQAHADFHRFREANNVWLPDYALFRTLGRHHGDRAWFHWPPSARAADPATLSELRAEHVAEIEQECFGQYLFYRQWAGLHTHARNRGIALFGDLPIYVAHDSADVWRQRKHFRLDASGQPLEVAGVPPDAFSASGQRWGNPLYDWDRLAASGYGWWIDRIAQQCALFDMLRVDHFRGFESYWAIPGDSPTAEQGCWRPGPGSDLFERVADALGPLPLVAEDLGDITPQVDALRRRHGFPGMRVLQFAFEGDEDNPHRSRNHTPDTVVYTGTHDNDTTLGWWQALTQGQRDRILATVGQPAEPMPRALVLEAMASVGRLAVIPMQDLLGLGREARMNTPGKAEGNWRWQLPETALDAAPDAWIRPMIEDAGRINVAGED